MFFSSWHALLRIVIIGVFGYLALIILLRISGKRTISKMNAFDMVITVAFGNILANIIVTKEVTLADGVVAFATLAGLQYVISWMSIHVPHFQQLVNSRPPLLVYRGTLLKDVMRQVRIAEVEILASLRSKGVSSTQVEAVVLETDGTLSVIPKVFPEGESALCDVLPHTDSLCAKDKQS